MAEKHTTIVNGVEIDQTEIYEHIEEMIRQGKARRGTRTLPDWFFTEPRPKAEQSVVEAVLEDRYSEDD